MSRMFIALAAAASVLTFAAGAQAQDRTPDQRTVSAKVDFSDAAQTRAFYAKLQAAAQAVCQSEVSDPRTANADAACERQTLNSVISQINAPQLSLLDDRANGRKAGDAATALASAR